MPSEALPPADWQRVLQANLTASFLCSQRVFEPMRRRLRQDHHDGLNAGATARASVPPMPPARPG
jgi:NAD(P)-dependent dehydrogenase (short-subunit alcohol dehydrogenase family)